jgi:hypothetical protein
MTESREGRRVAGLRLVRSRTAAVAGIVVVAAIVTAFSIQTRGVRRAAARGGWDQVVWLHDLADRRPAPRFPGRVVHVHDSRATDWDFSTGQYWDHVDQQVVTGMMEDGLKAVTRTTSVADAWGVLIPHLKPGQKLAIKVNLNNTRSDVPGTRAIDALIEPVNALVGALIDYGFAPENITVYDVTHAAHEGVMPRRLIEGCDYPGVRFVAWVGNAEPYASEAAHFHPPGPPGVSPRPLAEVLVEADYLINVPIAKAHDYAGVSIGFKNHLGSIDRCDLLHPYLFPGVPTFRNDYSPLVDLYGDPNIGGKTILTVCDALFGNCEHLWSPPAPWPSCGTAPNSLYLSTDPVALDCVVADALAREGNVLPGAGDYLALAERAGMGVFERAPEPEAYTKIEYVKIERD